MSSAGKPYGKYFSDQTMELLFAPTYEFLLLIECGKGGFL
jgi:hypothetical protein